MAPSTSQPFLTNKRDDDKPEKLVILRLPPPLLRLIVETHHHVYDTPTYLRPTIDANITKPSAMLDIAYKHLFSTKNIILTLLWLNRGGDMHAHDPERQSLLASPVSGLPPNTASAALHWVPPYATSDTCLQFIKATSLFQQHWRTVRILIESPQLRSGWTQTLSTKLLTVELTIREEADGHFVCKMVPKLTVHDENAIYDALGCEKGMNFATAKPDLTKLWALDRTKPLRRSPVAH